MKTRTCNKCNKRKPLSDYNKDKNRKDGFQYTCRECHKHYSHDYYINNTEKVSAQIAFNRLQKLDVYKQKQREYYLSHKEEIHKRHNDYRNNRYKININFKLRKCLGERLRHALKKNIKSISTIKLLGCSLEFFKTYLEKQFQPDMNWNNHNLHGWHIDHIIPCAKFDLTKETEQLKCFNYSNLQPLWAIDNWRKNQK